jgi:hypothetical protein
LSGAGTSPKPSWRMADQSFLDYDGDVEIDTKPNNDGYVMTVRIGLNSRRVFFDPAGRITHTR